MKSVIQYSTWRASVFSLLIFFPFLALFFRPSQLAAAPYTIHDIDPTAANLPAPAREALITALQAWAGTPPANNAFFLTALTWRDTWGIVHLTPEDLTTADGANPDRIFPAIIVKSGTTWQAAIYTDPKVDDLLAQIPLSQLSQGSRDAIFPADGHIAITGTTPQQYFNYKLPWRSGEQWRMTNSWHGQYPPVPIPVDHALDFDIVGERNADILAAASGEAYIRCNDGIHAEVDVITDNTNNEKIGYLHLDPTTLGTFPRHVNQGEKLGRMKETEVVIDTRPGGCGLIKHTHIHIFFPTKPFVIDGYTFDNGNLPTGQSLYSTQVIVPGEGPADDPVPPTGHFPDVPPSHQFFTYIETLYYIGAVNGYSDGTYRPDEDLTRGAAAKIIIIASGEQYLEDEPLPEPFPDVPPDHPFYLYIMRLRDLGITDGYSDGTYRPDEALIRGGMAKFIVLARDGEEPDDCDSDPFLDVDENSTFCRYIQRLKEIFEDAGVTLGDNGYFYPDDPVTRGQAAKLAVVGLGWLPIFPDVPYYHTFFRYIQEIGRRGIASGYSDGTFRPDDDLTRGAAAKFIVRGLGYEPLASDYPTPTFPDVPTSHTFYAYIEFLVRNGIVSGYSDGTFRPDEPVTRGAIAKMVVGALREIWGVTCLYNQDPGFSDVPLSHPFYADIQCLKELRITDGFSDGTYRPDNSTSRGQAAKFVYRAFVIRNPFIPQELTEGVNNTRETAPLYTPWERFVVPSGDQDWIQIAIPAYLNNLGSSSSYGFTTRNRGINADIHIEVYDAGGTMLAQANQVLVWRSPGVGTYYVRLTNNNTQVTDGVYTQFVVVNFSNEIYLPVIRR